MKILAGIGILFLLISCKTTEEFLDSPESDEESFQKVVLTPYVTFEYSNQSRFTLTYLKASSLEDAGPEYCFYSGYYALNKDEIFLFQDEGMESEVDEMMIGSALDLGDSVEFDINGYIHGLSDDEGFFCMDTVTYFVNEIYFQAVPCKKDRRHTAKFPKSPDSKYSVKILCSVGILYDDEIELSNNENKVTWRVKSNLKTERCFVPVNEMIPDNRIEINGKEYTIRFKFDYIAK